ncbi:MAG: DUF2239 family protein [Myxococcales bacterium]|nr:MAG: DUF2239 family protein [Myxococcales bacterium]
MFRKLGIERWRLMGEKAVFFVFVGNRLLGRGNLKKVVRLAKPYVDRGCQERIALFDEQSGRAVDVDFSGSETEVIDKLDGQEVATKATSVHRGPGRPKLGVVSREVTLLPRHWQWLSEQPSGASATLRRLVDSARKANASQDAMRKIIDAAHCFIWDIAGDQPGFEEAARALFAHKFDEVASHIVDWPKDIRKQLHRFIDQACRCQDA